VAQSEAWKPPLASRSLVLWRIQRVNEGVDLAPRSGFVQHT
jgi:hypothetical protein